MMHKDLILIIHFVLQKFIHSRTTTCYLDQIIFRCLSTALSIFLFGQITTAQDSISIGSAMVTPSTSEVVLPVSLAVGSDVSLLSLTINFESELLTTSAEKIVPVNERFPDGNIDGITTSVDNGNGVVSWTVSDFLGGAVIKSGMGALFTIEFSLEQMIEDQGTVVELTSVQASDTLLNTIDLAIENGAIVASKDSDQDGLSDDWEVGHFGDLRFSGDDDPDRDEISNADEFVGGSDPFAIDLNLSKGWNLISLGVEKENGSIDAIFGNKIRGLAWFWDNINQRYTAAQSILPENGYWVYSKAQFINEAAILIDLP